LDYIQRANHTRAALAVELIGCRKRAVGKFYLVSY